MQLVHGGDWAGFQTEYGYTPLDFSANVSPLGVPQGIQTAIANAAKTADRYPDPLCRALRQAIGKEENVPPEWILCGNGAADLIWRLAAAQRPHKAVLPAPSFAEYEAALQSVQCRVHRVFLAQEMDFCKPWMWIPIWSFFANRIIRPVKRRPCGFCGGLWNAVPRWGLSSWWMSAFRIF